VVDLFSATEEEVELCGPWIQSEGGRIEVAPGVQQKDDEYLPVIAIVMHRSKPIYETGQPCQTLAEAKRAAHGIVSDWFTRVAAETEAERSGEWNAEIRGIDTDVP
jgi:hypothetical protein